MTLPKRLLSIFLAIIGGLLLLGILYTWSTLHYSYSDGERAGFLQKISKKGWICKTWEGEMLLTSMPGAIPEKFEFTVRDDAVASQLTQNIGKRVVLTYAQRKGVPSSCFGDTQYFVEKIQMPPAS
jgi:hypothetical protein